MNLHRQPGLACTIVLLWVCASCAPSTYQTTTIPSNYPAPNRPQILEQAQTADLESSDRIERFRRLSRLGGITPPLVEELSADASFVPGMQFSVPVVRVVFDQGVFFDSDSWTPLPQAIEVLDLIAANMRRDVPDAALTILGHTDSTGTSAHNFELSTRRALQVMKMLTTRGVSAWQMTTVAIGEKQPIANNALPDGRARNRRVEFLISASPGANLSVVQNRKIDASYLVSAAGKATPLDDDPTVRVFQSQKVTVNGETKVGLVPLGSMHLPPRRSAQVTARPLEQPPKVTMRPIAEVSPAQLSNVIVD